MLCKRHCQFLRFKCENFGSKTPFSFFLGDHKCHSSHCNLRFSTYSIHLYVSVKCHHQSIISYQIHYYQCQMSMSMSLFSPILIFQLSESREKGAKGGVSSCFSLLPRSMPLSFVLPFSRILWWHFSCCGCKDANGIQFALSLSLSKCPLLMP